MDYSNKLYAKIIRKIKSNKSLFNVSKFRIKNHGDKKIVGDLLGIIIKKYNDTSVTIKDFLDLLNDLNVINLDYLSDIIGDEDYEMVLDISLNEFKRLTDYLNNPHISTQHGVKGESHETVIFMAANSTHNPVVNMTTFYRLWSLTTVDLNSFDKFYYEYAELIKNVEDIIGMKCTAMKKNEFDSNADKIVDALSVFNKKYQDNNYYYILLKEQFDKFSGKPGVTNLRNCLKENQVYGVLSAYRLFYVGCSRARKNLTVIINKKDVENFECNLKQKFKDCGFDVVDAE